MYSVNQGGAYDNRSKNLRRAKACGNDAFIVPEMLAELDKFAGENISSSLAEIIKTIARSLGD